MRKPILFFTTLIILGLVLTPFLLFKRLPSLNLFTTSSFPHSLQEKTKTSPLLSPQEKPIEMIIPEVKSEKQNATTLKLLNANLVGTTLKDNQGNKINGLRILGEVKNIGDKIIKKATVIVRFYKNDNTLLSTKIGVWNYGYKFSSLAPGEIDVYDVIIPEPPAAKNISIEIKTEETEKSQTTSTDNFQISKEGVLSPMEKSLNKIETDSKPVRLQIKEKKLEGTIFEKNGQQIPYFKFTGVLVNNNNFEVVNPGIHVWLKDNQNKVISATYQTFNNEVMIKEQRFNVELALLPINQESKKAYYTMTKTFGEKL